MSHQGWRGQERESYRQQNSRPVEEGPRNGIRHVPLGRHVSGKAHVFMVYVQRHGKTRFRNLHKYELNLKNKEDNAKIHVLYQEFKRNEPDKYAEIVEECEQANKNTAAVAQKRHQIARRNRSARHEYPDEYEEQRLDFVIQQQENKNAALVAMPVFFADIFTTEDQNSFFEERKKQFFDNMRSYFLSCQTAGNPFCDEKFKIQMISVIPYSYIYKEATGTISSWPAEIAITTFDLKNGITRMTSRIVMIDTEWMYGNEGMDETMRMSTEDMFKCHGISDQNTELGESPSDVIVWLKTELDKEPQAKIVCDQRQFNYVYYSLRVLATYVGHNAQRYLKDRVFTKLIGIQDFTINLLKVSPSDKHRRDLWRDEDVLLQFNYYKLYARHDMNLYCQFHERCPQKNKHYCCRAQSARLLHNFFRVLKANRIQGFRHSPSIHETCLQEEDNLNLPSGPEASLFTRILERAYDSQSSSDHSSPSPPPPPNPYYNVDELDSEDEDADFNGFYEASRPRQEPSSSRQAEQRYVSHSRHQHLHPGVGVRDLPNPMEEERKSYHSPSRSPPPRRTRQRSVEREEYSEREPSRTYRYHYSKNWEEPRFSRNCISQEDAQKYIEIAMKRGQKRYEPIDFKV